MAITDSVTDLPLATSLTGRYVLDQAHSFIGFSARHAMVTKVRGAFQEVQGTGYLDEEDPSKSHVELTIEAASIDTGNPDRDNHLRSNDFLAMAEHPRITFKSTEVQRVDQSHYRVTGDLTIRGVTRPVTIDFEFTGQVNDPWGNVRVGFAGSTTINRKDWGITWNMALEAGGVLVSDKVNLELDIAAVRAEG
jgi:polyisoprenoid-binding protein YceI